MCKGKKWAVLDATEIPSLNDVAFAAGFMEGDGYYSRNRTTHSAEFNQKDEWIIFWFQRKFGGAVGKIHRQGINQQTYWRWRLSGQKARDFMMLTYDYLSPRRQEQINTALQRSV